MPGFFLYFSVFTASCVHGTVFVLVTIPNEADSMDKTGGYELQKIVLFETVYSFALGCVPETLGKFAVWNFTETAYGCDWYRMTCHENSDATEENLQKRQNTDAAFMG